MPEIDAQEPESTAPTRRQGPPAGAVLQKLSGQLADTSLQLATLQAYAEQLETENQQLREELVQKSAES